MLVDIHAHILPGVDDGARDMDEARAMLNAAKAIGIGAIVLTPHVYAQDTSMDDLYARGDIDGLTRIADEAEIRLIRGCELNHRAIRNDGDLDHFCVEGTNTILLELPHEILFPNWESVLSGLCERYDIIIVHPERYLYLHKSISLLLDMRGFGCAIQVTAGAYFANRFGAERKTLTNIHNAHLVDYTASDAHSVRDYEAAGKLIRRGEWRVDGALVK